MATSYNGWQASRDPKALDIDPDFRAAGRKFPGGVKRGPVSVVLRYVIEQFDKRVEPVDLYDPGDEWGYHYKQSANSPRLLSCHSSGTAVDINATRHPNGTHPSKTFTPTQIDVIRDIVAECDGVVRWLGDARTPDPMHFEISGDEVEVARLAGRLLSTKPTPAPTPSPPTKRRKRMYLFRLHDAPEVWATDGLIKRHVVDLPAFKDHFAPSLEGRDVVVLGRLGADDLKRARAFLAELETVG